MQISSSAKNIEAPHPFSVQKNLRINTKSKSDPIEDEKVTKSSVSTASSCPSATGIRMSRVNSTKSQMKYDRKSVQNVAPSAAGNGPAAAGSRAKAVGGAGAQARKVAGK